MRGDEPDAAVSAAAAIGPFPTCVGMNRAWPHNVTVAVPVPHMRGDEPAYAQLGEAARVRSPHAWG